MGFGEQMCLRRRSCMGMQEAKALLLITQIGVIHMKHACRCKYSEQLMRKKDEAVYILARARTCSARAISVVGCVGACSADLRRVKVCFTVQGRYRVFPHHA